VANNRSKSNTERWSEVTRRYLNSVRARAIVAPGEIMLRAISGWASGFPFSAISKTFYPKTGNNAWTR
jgi:hypothetical protein